MKDKTKRGSVISGFNTHSSRGLLVRYTCVCMYNYLLDLLLEDWESITICWESTAPSMACNTSGPFGLWNGHSPRCRCANKLLESNSIISPRRKSCCWVNCQHQFGQSSVVFFSHVGSKAAPSPSPTMMGFAEVYKTIHRDDHCF
jgi:hypothetical protein